MSKSFFAHKYGFFNSRLDEETSILLSVQPSGEVIHTKPPIRHFTPINGGSAAVIIFKYSVEEKKFSVFKASTGCYDGSRELPSIRKLAKRYLNLKLTLGGHWMKEKDEMFFNLKYRF